MGCTRINYKIFIVQLFGTPVWRKGGLKIYKQIVSGLTPKLGY